MIFTYQEIKNDIQSEFNRFLNRLGYSITDTFYATMGESENRDDFTLAEECCMYICLTLLLKENNEKLDFFRKRLSELISDKNIKTYQSELKEEYSIFLNDVNKVKTFL